MDLGQNCTNSLCVPCALFLGYAYMDQAPVLPGSMNKVTAVFCMDCLLVCLLRERQNKREKSDNGQRKKDRSDSIAGRTLTLHLA